MITYFVHSTSRDNEAGVRAGWNDPELSAKGIEQAETLKGLLTNQDFDSIYASDLKRTIQTVTIALPGMEIVQDSRLREMNYGVLNGRSESEFPEDEYWCVSNRFDGGECCLDVQTRMESFLNDCYDPLKSIAVFSHKYPQLALEVLLNGLSWVQVIDLDWRHTGEWKPGWIYGRRLTCG